MAGVYIYSDKTSLAAELITFVKQSGKSAAVLTFKPDDAEELASKGADKVYLCEGGSACAENYSKAVAAFLSAEEAEVLVVGSTARGRDFAARIAGYLDSSMASEVTALDFSNDGIRCERMMHGGAVIQKEILYGLSVVTMTAGKYDAGTGDCEIITIQLQADKRVNLVESHPIVKAGTDLRGATKVVCVGMGFDKEEDMKMAKDLAAILGAELGCTRGIAEERHWLPASQYIGISGANIKPQLYLSMGVSGQVQHIFGVRDAKVIVAIDRNEKAPIFRAADYGIIGDMYEIVPLLIEALK